ncbi:MAG: hypothetical protein ABGX25_00495 [Nautiliaceae bacterium]
MVRAIFFLIFLLFIILFPVWEYKNGSFYKTSNSIKPANIPSLEIRKAKYFVYEGNMTKKGRFSKLDRWGGVYVAYDFYLLNLLNDSQIEAKKVRFLGSEVEGFDVNYFAKEYNLTTEKAVYFRNKKYLKGDRFYIKSSSFRGKGKSFCVDENKNIKAKNVIYYLRVES